MTHYWNAIQQIYQDITDVWSLCSINFKNERLMIDQAQKIKDCNLLRYTKYSTFILFFLKEENKAI